MLAKFSDWACKVQSTEETESTEEEEEGMKDEARPAYAFPVIPLILSILSKNSA